MLSRNRATVNFNRAPINRKPTLGEIMSKISEMLGEKLLSFIFLMLATAVIANVTTLWKIGTSVEKLTTDHQNLYLQVQTIQGSYAQTKDLKNIELIAEKGVDKLSHQIAILSAENRKFQDMLLEMRFSKGMKRSTEQ